MSVRCRIVLLIAAMLPSASVGRAEGAKLERRVYNVADLVVSLGDAAKGDHPAVAPVPTACWAIARETKPENGANRLLQIITNTIAPQSWSERGGPGAIEYFPLTGSLVVNQSPQVQDQIQDMLNALHRNYNQEVAVEVKLVLITDEVFQRLKRVGIVGDPKGEKHTNAEPRSVAFLNDREVSLLMEVLQGDPRMKVMQAPSLVVANGQTARINTGRSQTFVTGLDISQHDGRIECRPKTEAIPGTQICLRPLVSADRRSVRLDFDATLNMVSVDEAARLPITMPRQPDAGSPSGSKPEVVTHYIERPRMEKMHVEKTLRIPDQSTAVLTCWQHSYISANRTEVPILGNLPYVGELFRTTQYQTGKTHDLIFVTPRIVVAQEKEEKALPNPSAKNCPKAVAECVSATPARFCAAESDEEKSYVADDHRTLILPPIGEGETPQCPEPPDEAKILRAMLPIENPCPGIIQVSRDNIEIVTERIVDKIDLPRFFPLVGPARLHHCHWKCTVYYTETIESVHPALDFRCTKVKTQTVYVDGDHLHLCTPAESAGAGQRVGIQKCSASAYPPRDEAKAKKLADLLKQYETACESGRLEEARKLAEEALKLDPTCFRKH